MWFQQSPRTASLANDDRVVHRIREDRVNATSWKDIGGQHRPGGILRARERKKIGEIGRRVADLPRPIGVIRLGTLHLVIRF